MWRSTFIVSAMTMLSRILGLVRDMVLLNVFGAGGLMDAFLVAFKIPNFFRRLLAEGAFSQAFIPVLTDYKTNRLHADVQILISRVFGVLLTILSVMTVFAVVAAPAKVQPACTSADTTPATRNSMIRRGGDPKIGDQSAKDWRDGILMAARLRADGVDSADARKRVEAMLSERGRARDKHSGYAAITVAALEKHRHL